MSTKFGSGSVPRWAWLAGVAVVALAIGGLLLVTLDGDEQVEDDVRDVEASGEDEVLDDPEEDRATPGSDDDEDTPADSQDEAEADGAGGELDGIAEGAEGDGADSEADDQADSSADSDPGGEDDGAVDGGDSTISESPVSIALMVADAGALTPPEQSLTAMLEGNGHTVAPFTVTAEPIVNAVNNPSIDLLLFSPSFEFSLLYYPSDPNSLPMLDMARYSWYRRYVLPWGDAVVGPRFSGRGETAQEVFYDNADVIGWDQPVGPVQVLTAPRFSGEAAMREVMDYSTEGAAQYFLRHVSDTGAESALGVYVPPGSTITMPAPTAAEEQRFTSVAPWMGLLVFVDDPGDGNQYLELTSAGEGLFEAAIQLLMNG